MIKEEIERQMELERIESEIRCLVSSLDAPTSDIGDWKIVKIYEARLKGEPDPYNYKELAEKRQKVRDRINYLQAKIEK
jgi:hypothetical protein